MASYDYQKHSGAYELAMGIKSTFIGILCTIVIFYIVDSTLHSDPLFDLQKSDTLIVRSYTT